MITDTPPATRTIHLLTLAAGRELRFGDRPLVMGVVNLTPDSFSDGGRFDNAQAAIEHALEMEQDGADVLDLGAESTRPGGGVYGTGASEVDAEEELGRLMPVLEGLRERTDLPISVDTRKAAVAERALRAGADLINDISALGDPGMGAIVADADCPIVLMHSRGALATMQSEIHYEDLMSEILADLTAAVERATSAGIAEERIILDPGLGFGKSYEHNLSILRHVAALEALGRPILIGASRKSFIGHVTGREADQRLAGSLATAAWSAAQGIEILRVHDVPETVDLLRTWSAIEAGPKGAS